MPIQTFPDGSQLDTDTGQVIRGSNATPENYTNPNHPVASTAPATTSSLTDYLSNIQQQSPLMTSSPYRDILNQMSQDISSESDSATNDLTFIQQWREELEKQRQARINEINAQAEVDRRNTQSSQQGEVGSFNLGLAGMGALGRTVSGTSALQKQAATHREELAALDAKRQAAINAAQSAYTAKDFEAAQYYLKSAQDLRAQRQSAYQKLLDNEMKVAQESRTQSEYELTYQQSIADQLAGSLVDDSGNMPTDQEIMTYAEAYGVDPNILKARLVNRSRENQKFMQELGLDQLSYALNLEQGQTYTLPDGTIITGLKYPEMKKLREIELLKSELARQEQAVLSGTERMKIFENYENWEEMIDVLEGRVEQLPTRNRPQRNKNPMNIKYGGATRHWVDEGLATIEGNQAADGGHFLVFKSLEDGIAAAAELLFDSGVYSNLTVNDAMKKWSGNGYSGEDIVPGLAQLKVSELNDDEKATILEEMMTREGFFAGIDKEEFAQKDVVPIKRGGTSGTDSDFEQYSKEQVILSVLPTQLKNSEKELERLLTGIRSGLAAGKDPYDIADNLTGYKITKPDSFSKNIRQYFGISEKISATAPADFARLINAGNKVGAVTKLENLLLDDEAKKAEYGAVYGYNKGEEAISSINKQLSKLGIVEGNWNKLKKKFKKDKDFQSLSTQLTMLISEWKQRMTGVATTESELNFINDIIPKVTDNPWNAIQKIRDFQKMNLDLVNSRRSVNSLPSLDYKTLTDKNSRVKLYEGDLNTNYDWSLLSRSENKDFVMKAKNTINPETGKVYTETEILEFLQNK